jgi:hypothetical protein
MERNNWASQNSQGVVELKKKKKKKFLTSYYKLLHSLQLRYHLKWWPGPKKKSPKRQCNIL